MSEKRTEIEKERKWILKRLPLMNFSKVYSITQYYKDGYRYRVEQVFGQEPEYIKLKKEKLGAGINQEVNIENITATEYYMNKTGTAADRKEISKKRYVIETESIKYEIDVFENLSLIMMEIENVDIEDIIYFLPEIEKVVLIEVTGNEKFDNYNLAN